jgi:ankyrin repeat protein
MNATDATKALQKELRQGSRERIEELINAGADPNVKDVKYGFSTIQTAAARNDSSLIDLLMSKGADINARDNEGFSALQMNTASADTIQKLIQYGADPNNKNNRGVTVLHSFMFRDPPDFKILKLLVEKGADPMALFNDRSVFDALLNLKADLGDLSYLNLIKTILEKKPELLANPSQLISRAVRSGNVVVLQILKDKGIDLSEKIPIEEHRQTPLMLAFSQKRREVIKFLINTLDPSKLNAEDDIGNTALMYAIESSLDGAEKLIEKGANINATNLYGQTPLSLSISGRWYSLVPFLVGKGADTTIKFENMTPLEQIIAMKFKSESIQSDPTYPEALQVLLQKFEGDLTPLLRDIIDLGLTLDDPGIFKILTEKGVDIRAKIPGNETGLTPLMVALYKNKKNTMKFLVEVGGNPDEPDKTGHTALMYAISGVNLDGVNALLKKGASINLKVPGRSDYIVLSMIKSALRKNSKERVVPIIKALLTELKNRGQTEVIQEFAKFKTQDGKFLYELLSPDKDAEFFEILGVKIPKWEGQSKNQFSRYTEKLKSENPRKYCNAHFDDANYEQPIKTALHVRVYNTNTKQNL